MLRTERITLTDNLLKRASPAAVMGHEVGHDVLNHGYEADIFGLNAAGQPDGFAEAALLLGDYRKLDPSPLEEAPFFDHPSGRTRILAAMRWKPNSVRPSP